MGVVLGRRRGVLGDGFGALGQYPSSPTTPRGLHVDLALTLPLTPSLTRQL